MMFGGVRGNLRPSTLEAEARPSDYGVGMPERFPINVFCRLTMLSEIERSVSPCSRLLSLSDSTRDEMRARSLRTAWMLEFCCSRATRASSVELATSVIASLTYQMPAAEIAETTGVMSATNKLHVTGCAPAVSAVKGGDSSFVFFGVVVGLAKR